ncbi:siroheme synthase CysG [Hwanghaeella sp.]|uniref:siroheme synthase CysG n=1 Tax=Hwanghaeella sp. TaxID=2605943 RepID=UPI003CCC021C
MTQSYFPIFWNTDSGTALVVGGGEDAVRKVRLLVAAGARVHVVAPGAVAEIEAYADEDRITLSRRPVQDSDIAAAAIVIAATGIDTVDSHCAATAQAHGVKVNVVDRPDLSTFIVPSIVDRSPILVAISSAGTSPVLARRIRERIEATLSPNLGKLAEFAAGLRDRVAERLSDGRKRRAFWELFLDGYGAEGVLGNRPDTGRQAADELLDTLSRDEKPKGRVTLVGAGPGAADLLTLRALRALQRADVIIYDALVGPDVLDLARRDAFRLYVGKAKGRHSYSQDRINGILIDEARRGSYVVRLKGGDPFVFGRGGEEISALRDADIEVDVIPGITAATGAAAALRLPLTQRDVANVVSFATAHPAAGQAEPDFSALADPKQTAVIYMGKTKASEISAALIKQGRRPDTPVAVIENATLPDQRILTGTLGDLPAVTSISDLTGPALIVIGDVVSEADLSTSESLTEAAAKDRAVA